MYITDRVLRLYIHDNVIFAILLGVHLDNIMH